MGKSNRIRTQRAASTVKAPAYSKAKKSTPAWLTSLIAVAVAVLVLAGVVAGLVTKNGVVMRMTPAIKSENFTVNGNMLKYMFQTEYENFHHTYQDTLSSFSLDTSKSLKEQTFGDTTGGKGLETTVFGEFKGTWFDFFMNSVTAQAEEILIYCEEAKARGLELDENDLANIENTFTSLDSMVQMYNLYYGGSYNRASYIAATYGEGVKEKDIREFLKLSALASKCAQQISDELIDAITDDRINEEYNNNKLDYQHADYSYYTLSVKFSDLAKELIEGYDGSAALTDEQTATVLEAYKAKITELRAKAAEFAAYTDVEEFEKNVFNDIASTNFDSLYETEALADADKLSDEALAVVKTAMIAKLMEELDADAETTTDDTVKSEDGATITVYGQTVTENAAKALLDVKSALFKTLTSSKNTYIVEKSYYTETSDVSKWAFEDGRAAGDVKTVEAGDGANGAEVANTTGTFTVSVYMLKTPAYRDEEVGKSIAYMTFNSIQDANAAIATLKAESELTEESFLKVAADKSAVNYSTAENYYKGSWGYDELDAWLYDEATVANSYTSTPILLEEAEGEDGKPTYGVFFFTKDGQISWKLSVESVIYADDAEVKFEELSEKYATTINQKALDKIDV